MAHRKIKQVDIGLVKRNAPRRGPTSSDQWNDSWEETVNDLKRFSNEWNEGLIPLLSLLPDGTNDLDAYDDGLDGRTIFVDASVLETIADNTFFNLLKARPNSIKEQFGDVYDAIVAQADAFQVKIDAVTATASLDTTDFINKDGSIAMTGTFKAVGGDAVNPGLSFSGDENTGVFSPSADNLVFTAGGTEKLRLKATTNTFVNGLLISSSDLDVQAGAVQTGGVTRITSIGGGVFSSVITAGSDYCFFRQSVKRIAFS